MAPNQGLMIGAVWFGIVMIFAHSILAGLQARVAYQQQDWAGMGLWVFAGVFTFGLGVLCSILFLKLSKELERMSNAQK